MYFQVIFLLVFVCSGALSANTNEYDIHRTYSRVRRQSDSECGVLPPNGVVPWHSLIYSKKDEHHRYICGGSLISHTMVISAATCFWDNANQKIHPATNFAVAFGKQAREWEHSQDVDVQRSDVATIYVDARYRGRLSNYQGDIVLVALTTPVEYKPHIRPICFDFDQAHENRQLVGGNKGLVATNPLTNQDQALTASIEVPYMPLDECLKEEIFTQYVTADKICAGTRNGEATMCRGTSGSGLAFPDTKDNGSLKYFLRGILSVAPYTENKDICASMAAFTQISKHESFIKEHFYDASSIQL